MRPRLRNFLAVSTSFCVVLFLSLLAGCGGSSHSSSTSSTPAAGGSSGSGSSGSGSSGTNTGSSNTGSSGSSGTGSSGSGSSGTSSFVSYVYTAGASNISAFGVNADGSLTAAPNSPYAGGTDNYIVTNGANVYTIASDGMTLKVYSINKNDGSLTLANTTNAIAGNTFAGDIVDYLSLDHSGTSLYIGEFDSSGDDGVNFWQISSGPTAKQVQWDGDSEVFGPPLVWSPDNKYAYSGNCYHAGWTVFSYTRASNGTLTPPNLQTGAGAPPVMIPGDDMPCPVAFAVSAKGYLAIAYVPTPQGGTYMIGTYSINGDGSLTPVSNSQATTASNESASGGAMSINFDRSGAYLAAAGNGGVQTFALNSSGLLSPVGAAQDAGVNFQNVQWDNSNHVFATTNNQLYVFNASNGTLTPANGSPYGGSTGLAVLPLQ